MGAELSQGPCLGGAEEGHSRMHLLGSLVRTGGLLGRPAGSFLGCCDTFSLRLLVRSLSFLLAERLCVSPLRLSDSFHLSMLSDLRPFFFPCSSFISGSYKDFMLGAMVMQSRGHWEKTPEGGPGEVSVCERAGRGRARGPGPTHWLLLSLSLAFCPVKAVGGETGAGKAPVSKQHTRCDAASAQKPVPFSDSSSLALPRVKYQGVVQSPERSSTWLERQD